MKVTAHFSSYASGTVQICQQFDSIKAAVDEFRNMVNEWMDGIGFDGKPDATMWLYPFTPEDNDYESHNDYPMKVFAVGRRRHGEWTVKEEEN